MLLKFIFASRGQNKKVPGNEPYKGPIHAFTTILRQEGLLGFYRGIIPALILCSNGALQFSIYEELKIWKASPNPGGQTAKELGPQDYMILGAFSKSAASTITYPYQVIKSRMQQVNSRYSSTWATFMEIFSKQGVYGLFRGLVPNVIRVMPASAITFMTYEETKKFLMPRFNC